MSVPSVTSSTSATEELAEIARRQGLASTARLIERFHTPELFAREFPNDPRLTLAPHDDTLEVMRQMARRGLQPALVRPLLDWLANRPLERALLAWDLLATTLVPDAELLAELRRAVAPFKEVLPAPGCACIDLNAHRAESLIPAGLEDGDEISLFALANEFSLTALAELERRKDPLPRKTGVLISVRAIGRVLHLAHAPTLGAIYLDYQARTLGFRPAAHDLCELMFDASAAARLPPDGVQPGDLPPDLISDYAEYLTYRSYLGQVEAKQLHGLIQRNLAARPPLMPAPSVQLSVVRAHVCALARQPPPLPPEALDQICNDNKLWRYAARVRVVIKAALSPPRSPLPLAALHDYLTAFGNDRETAYEALLVGPADATWKQEALPLLVREVRALPHEVGVWRAIIMMIGDKLGVLEAIAEMRGLIERQSRL